MTHNTENTGVNPSTKQDGATPSDTPQVMRDEKGRILPGSKLNPEGNGGFADNPEHRSDGSWKKEETPRAKLEKMLSEMTVADFMIATTEESVDTNLGAKIGDIATAGRLANVFVKDPDANGKLTVNSKEFDSLMYFVYGSKSENDTTIKDEGGVAFVRGFILPTAPEDFIDKDIREQLPAQQQKDQ